MTLTAGALGPSIVSLNTKKSCFVYLLLYLLLLLLMTFINLYSPLSSPSPTPHSHFCPFRARTQNPPTLCSTENNLSRVARVKDSMKPEALSLERERALLGTTVHRAFCNPRANSKPTHPERERALLGTTVHRAFYNPRANSKPTHPERESFIRNYSP